MCIPLVFETLSSQLLRLEILDISQNTLTNDMLPSLGGFTSMKELYLSDTGLDSDNHIPDLCSMLKNLEVLDLSGNNFNDSDIASALSELSSLKSLNLGYTQLTPRSILNISKIRSLEILDLEGNQLNESILRRLENNGFTWPTNLQVLRLSSNSFTNEFLSSLTGLQRLKFLDLNYNQLNGSLDISGLLALTSLEILDLSNNRINSFVVHQVSGSKSLSKLDVLTLDYNMINGSKLRESLQPFSSIRVLSMNNNKIIGTITAGDFRDLGNLEQLTLDNNYDLDNEFFRSIGKLTSLKVLSVFGCGINGTLPPADWFKLKNLEELDLSQNLFVGSLPSSFLNMTSLRKLELSRNQFSGQFDSNIATLTSLESFGFTDNQFEVPVSFTPFSNHSNLKFIYGEGNKVILDLQPSMQTWIPKFQLQVLSLPSRTDIDSLPLPRFLLYQNNLTSLDFSSWRLEGKFPHWLFNNNTKLTELLVRNCSFTGEILLPLHPLTKMRRIDVSNNNITGQIPSNNISSILPNLQSLNLSTNRIQGSISPEFGKMSLLQTLDLSDNHLSGEIPMNLSGHGSFLKYLILSKNKLDGPIFPTLKYLEELYLDDNSFYGSIPSSFLDSSLIHLDLSYNNLVGKLPSVVGNLSYLKTLSLSNNHLEGSIPTRLVELENLSYLDISDNNLTGSVPSFINASVNYIHLSHNRLSGLSKRMFSNRSFLMMLDLSYNEITGSIQDMMQDLAHARLNILLLKGNRFTGRLPEQLCQLVDLNILDLSYNTFYGPIPNCLGKMPFENDDSLGGAFNGYIRGKDAHSGILVPNINVKANFTTKKRSYTYGASILAYMSGIDLSKNKLNGSIPYELGNLTRLRALNLSHNDLIGQIPTTFSNLEYVESLDLSFNMLSGEIPPQLNQLNSLAVFSVAHNNLSGDTPEQKGQFITFDESSYEGNSLLCGPPLTRSCHPYAQSPTISPNDEEDDSPIDMHAFIVSFGVAYTSILLVIVATLYINPYWRRAWFSSMELIIFSCYYFMQDNWRRFSNSRNL
ncbi:LRR receptor-like serine/threonine-protein kinase GSO1 [Vigna radiata var. radiata]|uniref:LRR receptor-like serine/threonine-protein kinase GSO1 n=1 Tax=Vigna radiata var. radiata TaxID=3916 RepID=A0A3Q0EQ59_VIGRR|nr:LRR receptor-like serine/threonine-protein kinase GSO1 [Vigna radiata var. radiata]